MKRVVSMVLALSMFPAMGLFADELVVYSGRSDKFVKPVVEEFTRQTGIKVLLHSAESTALINKMKLEKDRTDADLFISNDAGNLQKGSEEGLFATIPAELTSAIPVNYRAADNSWIGLSARARVLVVNTNSKAVSNIKSVLDLSKPEYKDRIAITQSSNGSFVAGVTVYIEQIGEEKTLQWLTGLGSNAGRNVFNKHSKVVDEVAKGKVDVGLVNHYYIYRHLQKDPSAPVSILLPDQEGMGIAWNVAGVAVSKYTKQKNTALKFVEFLASKEGQKIFAEVNLEYPTRTDVEADARLPKIASTKIADVPMAKLGELRDKTIDLIEKSGLN